MSLTLFQPVQRFCKYPLFFADLLKHTPVGDDPECATALETVLSRLKGAAQTVNKAATSPLARSFAQKTWLLYERLRINGQVSLCAIYGRKS